ncbi:MAG: DsbC family protein [Betaproteobacteria bacterium]|nr:DsbC family protein [Betaproteobacteria bacterium]MCC7217122.1 DsbC family protein [Burkholderiales bacterium]
MHRSPARPRVRAAGMAALAALALALAIPAPGLAADKPAPLTAEAAGVKKAIEQKFPGAEVRGVVKTPYFGLFEVQFDDRIVYTDAKAKYIVVGAVYDTETKVNLTEERQRKLNRVDVASLPLDLAIKKVKGTGERTLVVFSDADCPFCHKLEEELKGVDNVTIYTFLYPIDSLHPDAARKSRMIWCAPDRQKAWDAFFATGALPDNKGDCDNPVAKTAELGAKFKVNATPTLVFADGSIVPGALPAARLESELKTAEAEAKKLAAARKS